MSSNLLSSQNGSLFFYLKSLHIGMNSNKRELIYVPTKYNVKFFR